MQTVETSGDYARHLCHLMHMEEQCLHDTHQICQTNQTTSTSGGLLVVSIAHPDSTITYHADKTSIKAACLEEAWACFTQANDTPFLTPPLVNAQGLLNCSELPFKQWDSHSFLSTPEGTNLGAQLLFQHLKWPALEVQDCNLTLTKTSHYDSWKKANKHTTSSISAHFGHYKADTHGDTINAVHMALSAIPLKTSFSYNQWKKRINVMLEKSPGSFQVLDKLHIILLFEANFNQLNKHISHKMMYHTEQYVLVAGEQYGSQHSHSSITQSLNKCLAFNHIHQLKQAAIICSNDVKSCYDCIFHCIVAQSMIWCEVNKLALASLHVFHHPTSLPSICWFPNQHWHQYMGGSNLGHRPRKQHQTPNLGSGQNPHSQYVWEASLGAFFKLAISGAQVSFVQYSFADDTDLVQTGPSLTSAGHDVTP